MSRIASTVALILLAACGTEDLTELVVVIDTDLAVPGELDGLRLAIESPAGMRETSSPLGGAADPTLPVSFSLEHGGHSWLGPVTVTAEGTLGGVPVVAQVRRTSFVRGERRLLTLFLSRDCRGVACPAEETCDRGACVAIDVPPESLPRWQGEVPPRFDAGPGMDASMDGAVDGGPDGGIDGGPIFMCPDGLLECGASCVDATSDLSHCGACDTACGSSWGSPTCAGGACMLACEAGFADCNGDAADGCETDLGAAGTCGACDSSCADPSPLCARVDGASSCVGACPTEAPSMCGSSCVDTTTDPAHCGTCDAPCNPAHGTGECAGGACTLRACDPGFGDCDGDATNGCETTLDTLDNCGACGVACSLENATSACELGACAVRMCDPGFGDCDGDPASGCEQPLTTAGHCGECGMTCGLPNGTVSCGAGTCELVGCSEGWADCDGDASNGCETDVTTATDCGGCANACPAAEPRCTAAGGTYSCDAMCPSGLMACGTSCVDTATSPMHCGGCGMPCNPANATGGCVAGACGILSCDTGYANCNGTTSDGCEARLDSLTHCGACGSTCAHPNAMSSCASGSCAFVSCMSGFANCDGMLANGCEQRLDALDNCGSCGSVCALPNATSTCAGGTCGVASCNAGSSDCDGDPTDGCEDTSSDAANCGMCGNLCRGRPNAVGVCTGGSCSTMCNEGYADCDGSPGNGCECDPPPGAVSTCNGRDCEWTCASGFTDCDGIATNGCEVATGTDPDQCGTCGNVCPTRPSATRTCAGGVCGFVCDAGRGDCNASATDGCEIALTTNTAHCGACGNACPSRANATTTCAGGTCGFTCNAGFEDCNGLATDGCEVDVRSSLDDCGTCGTVCATRPNAMRTCASGTCGFSCNTGYEDCNGTAGDGCEINTATNLSHCGACMNTCPSPANATRSCTGGTCGFMCVSPWGNCNGLASDGCEADVATSTTNCGMCGMSCGARPNATTSCSAGACAYACMGSFRDCNSMTSDGCEADIQTSLSHCGACGTACPTRANATIMCSSGTCGFTCSSTYRDCNGVATDGCEVNTATSTADCGMCGTSCPARANASLYCASGACGFTCMSGFQDCNAMASDGCETSTSTLGNCGGCGIVCDISHASESCATGSCVMGACDVGWDNCDGSALNGCETDITTDADCGMCGNRCMGMLSCVGGSCV